jgi:hypothetical protein
MKAREAFRSKARAGIGEIEFSALPMSCRCREQVLGDPKKIDTVDKLFDRALNLFGPNECLGTRRILKVFKVQGTMSQNFLRL